MKNRFLLPVLTAGIALGSLNCATMNTIVPNDAAPENRIRAAGETLECAGKSREMAFFSTLGGSILSGVGTSLLTISINNRDAGLLLTGFGATAAGGALQIYSLVETYNASQYDQRAGELLSGEGFQGCHK